MSPLKRVGLFAPSRILSDVLQEIEYRKIVEEVMIKEGVLVHW